MSTAAGGAVAGFANFFDRSSGTQELEEEFSVELAMHELEEAQSLREEMKEERLARDGVVSPLSSAASLAVTRKQAPLLSSSSLAEGVPRDDGVPRTARPEDEQVMGPANKREAFPAEPAPASGFSGSSQKLKELTQHAEKHAAWHTPHKTAHTLPHGRGGGAGEGKRMEEDRAAAQDPPPSSEPQDPPQQRSYLSRGGSISGPISPEAGLSRAAPGSRGVQTIHVPLTFETPPSLPDYHLGNTPKVC
ncbi:hypothetical protein T484DRAFT_1885020 [Baffinella frigidus]|nr:hypothetical protein T484DRAFT_1885020 [Cryptophyta sp. CCMP2293]